ncbi:phenylalanine--tRNA ligase beta subunit-related protein [Anoxynatronum sibiricum]|uniref:Phenylalanine--tRNA ligase beta subunit-related protein n=2 Tax=Anoxynatronum sibiricum TaxID=210623 RepID=A0ABU9VVW1_9CLOT
MLEVTQELKKAYPGGSIGILALSGMKSREVSTRLEQEKKAVEETLRSRFHHHDRSSLKSMEPIGSYSEYYQSFRKTYHVLLQLESIVFKGKSIPTVSPAVEIMFMAELKNQMLTAGHDLDEVEGTLKAEVAQPGRTYESMSGKTIETAAGDMMITDERGILSSIIYGPDQRTRITPETERVVYTVYAPPGISKALVEEHLKDLEQYAALACSDVRVISEVVHEL